MNLIVQNLTQTSLPLNRLFEQYLNGKKYNGKMLPAWITGIDVHPYVNTYVEFDDDKYVIDILTDILERCNGRCGSFIVKENHWNV